MGVSQTVRVPKAAPQRPLTEAVLITIVVELAVEYHIPDGKVRVDVGVGVLAGAPEHVEYPLPTETQAAVEEAQTVRVPKAAPHRSSSEAVLITMVVDSAVEYHIPDGKVS